MTINDIKEKLYELENDFQIDFRAIKKYITFYNEYYEDNIIESYKKGRNLYFYFINRSLDIIEAKAIDVYKRQQQYRQYLFFICLYNIYEIKLLYLIKNIF